MDTRAKAAPGDRLVPMFITGCPRSGTSYVAKCLQTIGQDAVHEPDGPPKSRYVVDWRAVPVYDSYVMIVRNPVDVIASMTTVGKWAWAWFEKHTGVAALEPLWERSACNWLAWNEIAKSRAIARFRVEDLRNEYHMHQFAQVLAYEMHGDAAKRWCKVRTDTNKRRQRPDSSWEVLAKRLRPETYERVCESAESYGYLVDAQPQR